MKRVNPTQKLNPNGSRDSGHLNSRARYQIKACEQSSLPYHIIARHLLNCYRWKLENLRLFCLNPPLILPLETAACWRLTTLRFIAVELDFGIVVVHGSSLPVPLNSARPKVSNSSFSVAVT